MTLSLFEALAFSAINIIRILFRQEIKLRFTVSKGLRFWELLGFGTLSAIRYSKKGRHEHNVSEIGSVSVLK
jgi:hypothetical protein